MSDEQPSKALAYGVRRTPLTVVRKDDTSVVIEERIILFGTPPIDPYPKYWVEASATLDTPLGPVTEDYYAPIPGAQTLEEAAEYDRVVKASNDELPNTVKRVKARLARMMMEAKKRQQEENMQIAIPGQNAPSLANVDLKKGPQGIIRS